jgi:hypothetical protein
MAPCKSRKAKQISLVRRLTDPNVTSIATGVVSVVRSTIHRLIPSMATWYRMPKLGSQSVTYWKCQPVVIGAPSRNSEATKSTARTSMVNCLSSFGVCRGMNSTASAAPSGRNTMTFSR